MHTVASHYIKYQPPSPLVPASSSSASNMVAPSSSRSQPQSIRYERARALSLQHVCAYGSETLVPNDDICRLSYYLKCCVIGCGINIGIEEALLDYMNAHTLPPEQQAKIIRHALSDLNILSLLDRAFILDDKHTLLPPGTLNTFFEVAIASDFFLSINSSLTIATGQQVCIHKVMLCTVGWMNEYFMLPFGRYCQGAPIVQILGTSVDVEDEVSIGLMLDRDYTQQGLVVTPLQDHRGEANPSSLFQRCCSCLQTIPLNKEPGYRCTKCPFAEYCQDCYAAGIHNQTHAFERICRTSIEYLKPLVQRVPGEDSFLPDVPLAIAVPLESSSFPSNATCEPVARAVSAAREARRGAATSSSRKRRRGSGCSSLSSASSMSSGSQQRADRIRPGRHPLQRKSWSKDDDRKQAGVMKKKHSPSNENSGPSSNHQGA